MINCELDEEGLEGISTARKLTFDDTGAGADIFLRPRNAAADMMASLEYEMDRMDVDDSVLCEESFVEPPSTELTAVDSGNRWKKAQQTSEYCLDIYVMSPSPTKAFQKVQSNYSTPVRQSSKRRVCSDEVPSCPTKEHHYRSRLSMSGLTESVTRGGHRSPSTWGKRDSAFFEDAMEIGVP